MKLVTRVAAEGRAESDEIETLALSAVHLDYLEQVSQAMNPDMPVAFGWPHAIRAILDRFEKSGIDLTAASNEHEIAVLAAGGLRGPYGRRARISASLSSYRPTRQGDRRANRANQPATDRCRSGKPPRSGRE